MHKIALPQSGYEHNRLGPEDRIVHPAEVLPNLLQGHRVPGTRKELLLIDCIRSDTRDVDVRGMYLEASKAPSHESHGNRESDLKSTDHSDGFHILVNKG
jgi:hypothetical protein